MEKKELIISDCLAPVTTLSTAVECRMSARGGAKINKLLSLTSECYVVDIVPLDGTADISGRISYKALYTDDDGELRTMDYYSDFTAKATSSLITPSIKLLATATVTESDVSSRNDSELKVVSVVNIDVKGILREELEVVTSAPDLITRRDTISTSICIGTTSGNTTTDEEIQTDSDVVNILLIENSLSIHDTRVFKDKVVVSGDATAVVTYSNDTGIFTRTITAPFSEELAIAGATDTARAIADGYISQNRITLSGEGKDTYMKAEFTIRLLANVFSEREVEVVSDAFSTRYDLSLTYNDFTTGSYVDSHYYEERVSGETTIDGDAIADRVVTTSVKNISLSRAVASNQSVIFEGVLEVNVVYSTNEGYGSSEVSIPYAVSFKGEGIRDGDLILPHVSAGEITALVKNGKTISVVALVKFYADVYRTTRNSVITDITVGEQKNQALYPIIVYRVNEGDTLWDVAKLIGATPESIVDQNPDLTLPISAGDVITYYRPLEESNA